jgi:hypothetical protein
MAKKTVASLQSGASKNFTKVIRMVKKGDSGSYSFREEVVTKDKVNDFFKG